MDPRGIHEHLPTYSENLLIKPSLCPQSLFISSSFSIFHSASSPFMLMLSTSSARWISFCRPWDSLVADRDISIYPISCQLFCPFTRLLEIGSPSAIDDGGTVLYNPIRLALLYDECNTNLLSRASPAALLQSLASLRPCRFWLFATIILCRHCLLRYIFCCIYWCCCCTACSWILSCTYWAWLCCSSNRRTIWQWWLGLGSASLRFEILFRPALSIVA